MSRRWQGPVLLVATVVAVFACVFLLRPKSPAVDTSAAPTIDPAAVPQIGQVAPDFAATALDGSQVTLAGLRGKPVWLVFGASWCAACRAEAPDVQAASAKAMAQGVAVVAIYVDEDAAAVKTYSQRLGLTMTNVPDPQSKVADRYAARGVPAHFFLDANGIVRESILGIVSTDTAAQAIAKAQGARA